jgi:hypothetical protein
MRCIPRRNGYPEAVDRGGSMQDYDVVASDDEKVGRVIGTQGNYLIVEHGMLRKTRHAVPRDLAEADEGERVVRLSVPKAIFEEGPKADDDRIDETAVARYYGLGEGYVAPDTEGYGDVTDADPSRTAEQEARQYAGESAEEQRARVREAQGGDPALETGPKRGSVGIHQDRYEIKE